MKNMETNAWPHSFYSYIYLEVRNYCNCSLTSHLFTFYWSSLSSLLSISSHLFLLHQTWSLLSLPLATKHAAISFVHSHHSLKHPIESFTPSCPTSHYKFAPSVVILFSPLLQVRRSPPRCWAVPSTIHPSGTWGRAQIFSIISVVLLLVRVYPSKCHLFPSLSRLWFYNR